MVLGIVMAYLKLGTMWGTIIIGISVLVLELILY